MTNKDLVRKLRRGPDLDHYLEGRKKRYTTYGLGVNAMSREVMLRSIVEYLKSLPFWH